MHQIGLSAKKTLFFFRGSISTLSFYLSCSFKEVIFYLGVIYLHFDLSLHFSCPPKKLIALWLYFRREVQNSPASVCISDNNSGSSDSNDSLDKSNDVDEVWTSPTMSILDKILYTKLNFSFARNFNNLISKIWFPFVICRDWNALKMLDVEDFSMVLFI